MEVWVKVVSEGSRTKERRRIIYVAREAHTALLEAELWTVWIPLLSQASNLCDALNLKTLDVDGAQESPRLVKLKMNGCSDSTLSAITLIFCFALIDD